MLLPRRIASAGIIVACSGLIVGSVMARGYDSVEVRGAEFIAETDIVAACEIEAGVAYSRADLDFFEECLMSSGQFRAVNVTPEGSTLVVTVNELNDRPGRLDIGIAYDSRDGITGALSMERYNLFPGTYGAIELRAAKESRSLGAFLYRKGALGDFDLGLDMRLGDDDFADAGYRNRRASIEAFIARPFDNGSRLELGLGYRSDKMVDLAAAVSPILRSEEGSVRAPYVRVGYRYSSGGEAVTDTNADFSVAIDQYFWGLGTDFRTSELRASGDARFKLADDVALLFSLQMGRVSGSGSATTRAVDRFHLGGADFRGFAARGIGPKDGDWFLGAERYFVSSVEIQKDIGDVFGTSASIGLFADVGSAWQVDKPLGGIDDSRKIRSSAGISLTLDIGGMPVSAYLAKPVDYEKGDKRQTFGISFNHSF